ncbi:MAG: 30S ribosomal protein S9 [Nanoarchaeota archaeon]|nr:30S ribosomal protein S9 [Nanoarchaeota archaeon]MBU1321954.1 30S ribosomal protein S9 [Nanoarchaeota archaeon]MBU1597950.1 30S ribosomal protein S9 [Nanoarchaeota archaeon]MBU2441187.1 30S ribosomal protein S9 [Nanoarchaeota archaeon]
MTDKKTINTHGKRKRAVSRANLKSGKGNVTVNNVDLDNYQPRIYRLRIREPLILAGPIAEQVNIAVTVIGGGIASQTDAVRLAIAKALVEYSPKLKKIFLDYDRQLLVADVRRKERAKPNRHGQARAKRQKSYR